MEKNKKKGKLKTYTSNAITVDLEKWFSFLELGIMKLNDADVEDFLFFKQKEREKKMKNFRKLN